MVDVREKSFDEPVLIICSRKSELQFGVDKGLFTSPVFVLVLSLLFFAWGTNWKYTRRTSRAAAMVDWIWVRR